MKNKAVLSKIIAVIIVAHQSDEQSLNSDKGTHSSCTTTNLC